MKQYYTHGEAQNLIFKFEKILAENGITIAQNSELEKMYLTMLDIFERHSNRKNEEMYEDIRPHYRVYLGLKDMLSKICSVSEYPDFKNLIPHLKKLNNCKCFLNDKASPIDRDNDKIIELYIAAICMKIGRDVIVDHPECSTGTNPDILADINGKKWGFACKTLHTINSQTIFENLEKAVDQIEKSPALIGLPILNLKNVIDHSEIWPMEVIDGQAPIFTAYPNHNIPYNMLLKNISNIFTQFKDNIGVSNIKDVFLGKKSIAACIIILQTATGIVVDKLPFPTRLNCSVLIDYGGVTQEVKDVVYLLNEEMQKV